VGRTIKRIAPALSVFDQILLLLHEVLSDLERDLERVRDDVGRREREPLRQRDVLHAVALVYLNPDELFGIGCVLDIMACVGRDRSQSAPKIKRKC
jgi:hypothetical protein